MYSISPILLVSLQYPFFSSGNNLRLINESYISSLFCSASIFHIIGRHVMNPNLVGLIILGGVFGSMWFFLLSSVGVCLFHVGIYSFHSQSIMDRNFIFKPVFMYATLPWRFTLLSVALGESRSSFLLSLFWVLTIFPCCLSNRLFCNILFVPIFSKIILLPCYTVVEMCSCIYPLFSERILFQLFGMSFFCSF